MPKRVVEDPDNPTCPRCRTPIFGAGMMLGYQRDEQQRSRPAMACPCGAIMLGAIEPGDTTVDWIL